MATAILEPPVGGPQGSTAGTAEVDGDISATAGPQRFAGNVRIKGTVLDGAQVSAGGDLEIGQAVEVASVDAAGSIEVSGGIVGRDRGRCVAGRDVRARFISGGDVEAGGDVIVRSEVTGAHVTCAGKLLVEGGPVAGGHVCAAGGLVAHTVGSPKGIKTIVEVGADPRVSAKALARLPEIRAQRERAQKVKAAVEPLMKNQKTLSAAQKEKATELLFEADELLSGTAQALESLQKEYEQLRANAAGAQIAVADVLHAGVVLRFVGVETTVKESIKGPVRVVVKGGAGPRTITVVEDQSKTSFALETVSCPDAALNAIRSALGDQYKG